MLKQQDLYVMNQMTGSSIPDEWKRQTIDYVQNYPFKTQKELDNFLDFALAAVRMRNEAYEMGKEECHSDAENEDCSDDDDCD